MGSRYSAHNCEPAGARTISKVFFLFVCFFLFWRDYLRSLVYMHNYNVLIRFKSGFVFIFSLRTESRHWKFVGGFRVCSHVLYFSSSILCCHIKSGSCVLGTESTHWLIVPPQFGDLGEVLVAVVFQASVGRAVEMLRLLVSRCHSCTSASHFYSAGCGWEVSCLNQQFEQYNHLYGF